MVSQGTPKQLGEMLVQMGYDSLKERGKNPDKDAIQYCWHYSNATVTDQNSWQVEGEKYIKAKYPNWKNVAPSNYYSNQDAEQAISVGESVLAAHPNIDLIICNDSTALPGQAQAAQNKGKTAKDITITGFASPNSMKQYCKDGILTRWGLWDCGVQGAMGCYMGTGTVVIGLAAVILGESIFKKFNAVKNTTMVVTGAVLYKLAIAAALRAGLNPNDLKLVTALIVVAVLAANNFEIKGLKNTHKAVKGGVVIASSTKSS